MCGVWHAAYGAVCDIPPPPSSPLEPGRQFFLNGKTLPIQRGGGTDQPIMSVAAARLRQGDWLHMFPEGKINFHGRLGAFRYTGFRV